MGELVSIDTSSFGGPVRSISGDIDVIGDVSGVGDVDLDNPDEVTAAAAGTIQQVSEAEDKIYGRDEDGSGSSPDRGLTDSAPEASSSPTSASTTSEDGSGSSDQEAPTRIQVALGLVVVAGVLYYYGD